MSDSNDKNEYLSRVLDIPDTPVSFDTINIQFHALPIHSSLTHDAIVVPVDSEGFMNSDDSYSDTVCNNVTSDDVVPHSVDENMITDEASSTCIDDADEIDGDSVDEEDAVVSSRALETVMEEFERDIEEYSSSEDETGESISSSLPADGTITCNDAIDSTRDKL